MTLRDITVSQSINGMKRARCLAAVILDKISFSYDFDARGEPLRGRRYRLRAVPEQHLVPRLLLVATVFRRSLRQALFYHVGAIPASAREHH